LARLLLVGGEHQLHAKPMISTPLSLLLDRTPPPQAGRASQAGDSTFASDFADLVSRLFYANMPLAALARAAEISGTMVPPPDADRTEPERKPEAAEDVDRSDETRPEAKQTAETIADAPAEPATASVSDEPKPQEEDSAPLPVFPLPQAQLPAAPSATTPPAQQAADRTLTQSVPATVQAKDAEPPQTTTQQGRHAQTGSGDFPRVQVVDASAKDQPPPLGHMLSGRAAIVAQSGDGGAAPVKDAAPAPKGGTAEQPAAALFGGAVQATSAAAQKAKGQSRQANPGGAAQAAGGQPAQISGTQAQGQAQAQAQAQAQQAATPAQAAAAQSGFGGALAAAANEPGQPGSLSPQAARSEPLPLVGDSGQQTPQALRTAQTAAAAKPRMPVPPRFIADQVAVQIQKSLSQGNDRISIQLKPAELGKVEVRLDVGHEGRVTAVITADRADTLDLLQRDARILQHSLQDAGLHADSNSLSFELRSQGQAFDTAQNGTGGRGGFAEAGADDIGPIDRPALPVRPGIVTNDRVDIHV
jgi:hypothetical protein